MTKIVELIIDEENEENQDGVFAISLVEAPAIESDFIALSKQEKRLNLPHRIKKNKSLQEQF